MNLFLVAFVLSLAWATYATLTTERRSRAAWSEVEQPAIAVGDPPYRSFTIRPRLARAPGLVRLAAFGCLWLGQVVMLVMVVPALFGGRGRAALGMDVPAVPWRSSRIAYDLGLLLLRRDRQAPSLANAVIHMLRAVAGAFAVFAGFGLMGIASSEPIWWILLGYAASIALLAGLLSFSARRHGDSFGDGKSSEASERVVDTDAAGEDIPTFLLPGDESTFARVEHLRAPAASRSHVQLDELWRVLESGVAPLSARAAAAIALGASLEADERRRFDAVKGDAPYPLRVALKAALGADTGAMAHALDLCADD